MNILGGIIWAAACIPAVLAAWYFVSCFLGCKGPDDRPSEEEQQAARQAQDNYKPFDWTSPAPRDRMTREEFLRRYREENDLSKWS